MDCVFNLKPEERHCEYCSAYCKNNVAHLATSDNTVFSITRKECEQLEKEYRINDIIFAIGEALVLVGDVKLSEAREKLKKMTRFGDQLGRYTRKF